MVEDLGMRRERGFQAALLPTDTLTSEEICSGTASTRTQPHGGQLPVLHGLQGLGAAGHVSGTALLPSTDPGGASVKDEPARDCSCFPTGRIQAGGPPTATWGEKPALLSTENSPNLFAGLLLKGQRGAHPGLHLPPPVHLFERFQSKISKVKFYFFKVKPRCQEGDTGF